MSEQTMTPDEVLALLSAGVNRGAITPSEHSRLYVAVAALIARNAELEAERDALRTALAKLVCEPGKPEYRDQARAALAIDAARAEAGHG